MNCSTIVKPVLNLDTHCFGPKKHGLVTSLAVLSILEMGVEKLKQEKKRKID